MLKVALLGAGRIGQIHGQNIAGSPDVRLVSVSDANQDSAIKLAAALNTDAVDVDAVFDDRSIDVVWIATSTDTHADFLDRAAAAGKAVFCEKPIDLSTERVTETLARVEAAGIALMIGFNRRFDPNFAELKERVDAGVAGEVELVTILSRDPAPPPASYIERSGGLFRDMMVHDLDMARFLTGEEFVEVHAAGSALVVPEFGDLGDVDTASVILKTASGKICQISNSRRAAYGYDQRIEVHGSKGLLSAGNVHETTVNFAGAGGILADPVQHFFLERYEQAFKRECAAFFKALKAGTTPTPSGRDGLAAQRLTDAATEACFSRKTVFLDPS